MAATGPATDEPPWAEEPELAEADLAVFPESVARGEQPMARLVPQHESEFATQMGRGNARAHARDRG